MTILTNPRTVATPESLSSRVDPVNPNTAEEIQSRFLKLLTTQLQNQTPDNPLDNAQMTTQFAQISMLQGIEKLNNSVEKMLGNQASVAANLVGKSTLVNGSNFKLSTDNKANLVVDLPKGADDLKVEIIDSKGKVIHTKDLGSQKPGITQFEWKAEKPSSENKYSFMVKAKDKGGNTVPSTLKHYEKIVSISWNPKGEVTTTLENGDKLDFSEINQISI